MSNSDIFIDVPIEIKCFINETNCEDYNIKKNNLITSGVFFLFGYSKPNKHLNFFILSLILITIMSYLNMNTNYIVDTILNMSSYTLGSYIKEKI